MHLSNQGNTVDRGVSDGLKHIIYFSSDTNQDTGVYIYHKPITRALMTKVITKTQKHNMQTDLDINVSYYLIFMYSCKTSVLTTNTGISDCVSYSILQ